METPLEEHPVTMADPTMSEDNEAEVERLLSEKLLEGYVLLEVSCPACVTPLVKRNLPTEPPQQQHDADPLQSTSFDQPFEPVQGVPFCVCCSAHVVTKESEISVLEQCESIKVKGSILVALDAGSTVADQTVYTMPKHMMHEPIIFEEEKKEEAEPAIVPNSSSISTLTEKKHDFDASQSVDSEGPGKSMATAITTPSMNGSVSAYDDLDILGEYSVRREIATKVLGAKMIRGYTLKETQCTKCSMPLMQKNDEISCVVCPALARKARRKIRERRRLAAEREKLELLVQQEKERKELEKLEAQRIEYLEREERRLMDEAQEAAAAYEEEHVGAVPSLATSVPVINTMTTSRALGPILSVTSKGFEMQPTEFVAEEPIDDAATIDAAAIVAQARAAVTAEANIDDNNDIENDDDNENANEEMDAPEDDGTESPFDETPETSMPITAETPTASPDEEIQPQVMNEEERQREELRLLEETRRLERMERSRAVPESKSHDYLLQAEMDRRRHAATAEPHDEAEAAAATEEARLIAELQAEADAKAKLADEAIAKARAALDSVSSARKDIIAQTIAEAEREAILEAEQFIRAVREDYKQPIVEPSASRLHTDKWDVLRAEGKAVMTRRIIAGWTPLADFCRGPECEGSALVEKDGVRECVVCGGSGNGKDGRYDEETVAEARAVLEPSSSSVAQANSRDIVDDPVIARRGLDAPASADAEEEEMVMPANEQEVEEPAATKADDNQAGAAAIPDYDAAITATTKELFMDIDFMETLTLAESVKDDHDDFEAKRNLVSSEISNRMMDGWLLLDMSCDVCSMPLMDDTQGNSEICILCDMQNKGNKKNTTTAVAATDEATAFATKASFGAQSAPPTATMELTKAATTTTRTAGTMRDRGAIDGPLETLAQKDTAEVSDIQDQKNTRSIEAPVVAAAQPKQEKAVTLEDLIKKQTEKTTVTTPAVSLRDDPPDDMAKNGVTPRRKPEEPPTDLNEVVSARAVLEPPEETSPSAQSVKEEDKDAGAGADADQETASSHKPTSQFTFDKVADAEDAVEDTNKDTDEANGTTTSRDDDAVKVTDLTVLSKEMVSNEFMRSTQGPQASELLDNGNVEAVQELAELFVERKYSDSLSESTSTKEVAADIVVRVAQSLQGPGDGSIASGRSIADKSTSSTRKEKLNLDVNLEAITKANTNANASTIATNQRSMRAPSPRRPRVTPEMMNFKPRRRSVKNAGNDDRAPHFQQQYGNAVPSSSSSVPPPPPINTAPVLETMQTAAALSPHSQNSTPTGLPPKNPNSPRKGMRRGSPMRRSSPRRKRGGTNNGNGDQFQIIGGPNEFDNDRGIGGRQYSLDDDEVSRAETVTSQALDSLMTRIEIAKASLLDPNADVTQQAETAKLIEQLASAAIAMKKLESAF